MFSYVRAEARSCRHCGLGFRGLGFIGFRVLRQALTEHFKLSQSTLPGIQSQVLGMSGHVLIFGILRKR